MPKESISLQNTQNPNNKNISSTSTSSTEDRALKLLGTGLNPEVVASATGVSISRISQLLSDPAFSGKVLDLRYHNLQKHNDRDDAYDAIEDSLVKKMKDLIPLMYKPQEVLHAIRIINNAKRRGASAPQHADTQTTVVNITLPAKIHQKFVTNIANQVISAGAQDLITVQSSAMSRLLSESSSQSLESSQVLESSELKLIE